MLNKRSQIKYVFQKFTTNLPSSAPVERLSTRLHAYLPTAEIDAGDIVEKLLLLKTNRGITSDVCCVRAVSGNILNEIVEYFRQSGPV